MNENTVVTPETVLLPNGAIDQSGSISEGTILKAVQDLGALVGSQLGLIDTIENLVTNGNFKYLSKDGRNAILQELLKNGDGIDDGSKGLFKQLKQIKRESLPAEIADATLIAVLEMEWPDK